MPLNVAVIGYGLAGAVFHAPLIATTPEMRLAAIVTGDAARQEQARRDHPAARILSSVDELWEIAPSIDLVVVATPNRTHATLARAAIAAGLPVVVDKPFATTAAGGRELVAEAQARGVMLTVFQNRRWDGDFLTLRRLLADGTLGRPLLFESNFERWRPELRGGWKDRDEPGDATGVLYDLGSHLIDQALVLLGPVRSVYAELDRARAGTNVVDDAFVALVHASGARSHLRASLMTAQLGPRFRFLGTGGAYVKHGMDPQEDRLRAGARPGPGWGEDDPAQYGSSGSDAALVRVRTEPGDYPAFYAGVARALRDRSAPPVDPADSIAGLDVIEAAIRSANDGNVVAL